MEWLITNDPVPYDVALSFMEKRVAEIKNGTAEEVVWLLEHPPLYTAGTSANNNAFQSIKPGAVDSTPTTGPGNV